MAIIIKTTGEVVKVEPANGNIFTLKELQKAVNGYIQIVPITTGEHADKFMIVDEEGLIKPNQINVVASKIAGQHIVGQVIIIDKEQIE